VLLAAHLGYSRLQKLSIGKLPTQQSLLLANGHL